MVDVFSPTETATTRWNLLAVCPARPGEGLRKSCSFLFLLPAPLPPVSAAGNIAIGGQVLIPVVCCCASANISPARVLFSDKGGQAGHAGRFHSQTQALR